MLEPLFEPLLPQPRQLQLGLGDLISLPIGKWHYTYIPNKFHGQIVSLDLAQKMKVAQWLRPVHSGSPIIKFGYYPEYARGGTLRVLTKKWEKVARRHGAKDPEQRRAITSLSKRMCKAECDPAYRENARNKSQWRKKYQELVSLWFRFARPQWEPYLEARVTIQPPPKPDDPDIDKVLVEAIIAYDPYVNLRSDVWWSIDRGSWKKAGLVGNTRVEELKKIEKEIVRFGTANELFEDDQ